jgi:murein DD-endopeptidase MepM/ murein hydrolase activator NlpD
VFNNNGVGGSNVIQSQVLLNGYDFTTTTPVIPTAPGSSGTGTSPVTQTGTGVSPTAPSKQYTTAQSGGTEWTGRTGKYKVNLGNTQTDESRGVTCIEEPNTTIPVTQTPIKNRRIGKCSDGVYKIQTRATDTPGNSTQYKDVYVERDSVAPQVPNAGLSKSQYSAGVYEKLDLNITGEAKTTAIIKITSNVLPQPINRTITIPDSANLVMNDITNGYLQCGGVVYTVDVKLVDRAGNISTQVTQSITSGVCIVCGSGVTTAGWVNPIQNRFAGVSSGHSSVNPGRLNHTGIDIAVGGDPYNEPVYAAKGGTIKEIENKFTNNFGKADAGSVSPSQYGGYANYIYIDHGGGLITRYAHLGSVNVVKDQIVTAGQQIGIMGSTGNSTAPHLHFEIRINGVDVNPQSYVFQGNGNANTQQSSLVCNTTARDADESVVVTVGNNPPPSQYGSYNEEDTTDKRNPENTAYTCDNYQAVEQLRNASSSDVDDCLGAGEEQWYEKEVDPNDIRSMLIDKALQDKNSSDLNIKAQGIVMETVWNNTNNETLLCIIDEGELAENWTAWIDTAISFVPIAGDVYQIFISISGSAFTGNLNCVQRWLNGVFGVVGLVSSLFTAGGAGVAVDVVKLALKNSLKKGGKQLLKEASEFVSKKLLKVVFTEISQAVKNESKNLLFTGAMTGIVYSFSPELQNSNSSSVDFAVSAVAFAYIGKSPNGTKAKFATKATARNVPNHIQKSRNEIANKIGNAVGSYNLCAGQFTTGQRKKAKVQCHHINPKYIIKYNDNLRAQYQSIQDSGMPAVALTQEQHQAFHDALYQRIPLNPTTIGNMSTSQINQKLLESYQAIGRADLYRPF